MAAERPATGVPGPDADLSDRLAALLARVARADRAAFAELYDLTAAKLFGVAVRMLRHKERAEDVVQECFVAVWQRAGDFDPARGAAMTWLMTILRHRAVDSLRRRGRQPEQLADGDEALLALVAPPTDDADRSADLAALKHCLDELGEPQRRVMVLSYCLGFTQEELAARLATPIGTIKSWMRRSLERLKLCLDG